jgi:membrane fusion protein, heavy metal efflux system
MAKVNRNTLHALGWILMIGALTLVPSCKGGKAPMASQAADAVAKGPHGGKLFKEGTFSVEVTIYERGVPPVFRLYFYLDGKPIPPAEVTAEISLLRHGARVDNIRFAPQVDYLLGDKVVEEPHSFDVSVTASHAGASHKFAYSQREGRVELSDEAVKHSAIRMETSGPVKMRSVLDLPGEITLNADKLAHIVPRLNGVIREIRKNQGDDVKKGEVIAVLDSRELADAKREYLQTSNQLAFAKKALDREQGLWDKKISSEASFLEAERSHAEARLKQQAARQQLEALGIGTGSLGGTLTRYDLRAPFDGVLIEKKVAIGQAVKDDDDLFTIADLRTVWVNVNVYAKDLRAVKVGQAVTVKSTSVSDAATGNIVYLGSLVGAETRSAQARVVLADPTRQWRAGLFVTVQIVQEEVTVPVAVKREGLQKFRDWDVVFVRVGNEFEARPLELGRIDGDWIEVVSGLGPNEKYAGLNSFILKADVGKSGASHDH